MGGELRTTARGFTRRSRRRERLEALRRLVTDNPFLTDEEIAGRLGVSSHTVRYDRLALGIPEMRRRTAEVAHHVHSQFRSLAAEKAFGEVIDLEAGRSAMSLLETSGEMALDSETGIVGNHYIFAQADSLALAAAGAPMAFTRLVNLKFKRSVAAGEKLIARAEVIRQREDKTVVLVVTRSRGEQVFRGKFVVSLLGRTPESRQHELIRGGIT